MTKTQQFLILAFIISVPFFTSCHDTEQEQSLSSHTYIAHGGGDIEGQHTTNSLEAVQNAIDHGITIIELDLALTTDSCIIAAHDWPYFHKITGYAGNSHALSMADVKNRKILDKFTPLTETMIDSIMDANPQLYLMTDKISDPQILDRFKHHNRIMVEAFTYHDYRQLERMDFHKIFYSSSPYPYPIAYAAKLLHTAFCFLPSVPNRYTFWFLGHGSGDHTSSYHTAYGDEFAVFTVTNRHEADSLAKLDHRIRYVYINNVE